MYKVIASDMDETFLNGEHAIPAPNVAALRRLHELGVLFVPSSGRGYESILHNFRDVDPALLEGTYVISYNGATINRFGDPEPLLEHHLDHDVADEMWRLGIERGLGLHAYTPDSRVRVRGCPPDEAAYLASLKGIEDYPEPTLEGLPVVSKMLFMSHDMDMLHEFAEAEVLPRLAGRADVTYSSGRYLEVIPKGVNKGTGLEELARLMGIDVAETIGFGDSANDAEMLRAAGLGVGVANVSDEARPSCDLVLDTCADDGALAELVERVIDPQHEG